jgi:hypothetical protein
VSGFYCPVKVVALFDREVSNLQYEECVGRRRKTFERTIREMHVNGWTEVVGVLKNKICKSSRVSNTN